MHEGAEPGAGGHERQRAGGTAAQGLQAAVRRGSVGVQGCRVVAGGGVAVRGTGGRSGGGVLVRRSFQELHGGDPSAGPPALLGVHVGEGGTAGRGGPLQGGEGLQLLGEGRAAPGSGCRSAALRRRRALPEQHHSTAALIGNMVSTCSPNVWGGGGSGDKWLSLYLSPSHSLTLSLSICWNWEGSTVVPIPVPCPCSHSLNLKKKERKKNNLLTAFFFFLPSSSEAYKCVGGKSLLEKEREKKTKH